ncbi:MAG: 3'-5' exonuclease [Sphaerochaetaceae bacterium]|nr:3'-5' exonuclease [Sphaerochaetaceae bacterium]
MTEIKEFTLDEINHMGLSPYQMYGLDITYQQYYSIQHYLQNSHDTIDIDQLLNINFIDIEVFTNNSKTFPKPELAAHPINAITTYNTFNKTFYSYLLLQHSNIQKFPNRDQIPELINSFKKELITENYISTDDSLQIEIFSNEIDLIKSCWKQIKNLDPAIISGWNCDMFDIPYIYFRLGNLLNSNEIEIGKILSNFGKIKVEKNYENFIKIPEFPIVDLLYAYKPRDDGGLSLGSKQSSYALDFVAMAELKLHKKEYKHEGMTLDNFYESDPVNFLLYNIIDVALCVKLNNKLKHIEAHNLFRRLMKTPLSSSLKGSSINFDTYVNYKLNSTNKYVRFGIVDELNISISDDDISLLYIPKTMNKTIKEVSKTTFRTIAGHFSGAYVKDSTAQILTNENGLIVDMDASSLYPSMINQMNISFDTFFGKLIDFNTYKFLDAINTSLINKTAISQQIYSNLHTMILTWVDKTKPQNKSEHSQNYYIIMAYLLKKINDYKKPLTDLYNPQSFEDYVILKRYLLPLIDLFDNIHPNNKEYESFSHEYLINDSLPANINKILIIENILKQTISVRSVNTTDFKDYLKQNNILLSLSGCLFVKHEIKKGLFIDFLKNLKLMRNEYEKKRDQFPKGSSEYSFFDMRQKAIKVSMNTTLNLAS